MTSTPDPGLVPADESNVEVSSAISPARTDNKDELLEKLAGEKGKKYGRFALAALGSIPWVGGVIGGLAGLSAEKDQSNINELQKLWLNEHETKVQELLLTINEIIQRLESFGQEIQDRIESQQYLTLVRRTFRSWDQADTSEKRQMLKRLITNAGAITLCPDDLVRLFANWIDLYHEAHFMVIREIYRAPGVSRGAIWDSLHTERPREDSAEADLYRYLIRDLSMGGVIRQEREVTVHGGFVRRTPTRRVGGASAVMESAFEDSKTYELTELGKQFVHYVMDDVAPQIEGAPATRAN